MIIDGMDNFKVRFLINEVCHKYQIPWVYGAAVGSKGTIYGIDHQGPCLKCLMQTMPETGESCAINGVLPPIISIVASYEVAEAIRYLAGKGFSKQLITVDAFDINYKAMNIDILKNKDCPVCENQEYDLLNLKRIIKSNLCVTKRFYLDYRSTLSTMLIISQEMLLNQLHSRNSFNTKTTNLRYLKMDV